LNEDSEKEYLQRIGKRVEYYFNIRKKAVEFIYKNKIKNKDLSVHIVFIAALWAAHKVNEELTQEELLLLFGLVSTEESEFTQTVMKLHPDQADLTLDEVLNLTVENFK
jgi:hypothetical protein